MFVTAQDSIAGLPARKKVGVKLPTFLIPRRGNCELSQTGSWTGMNAELLAILEYWEREKGINRNVLLAAVEEALLSAAKKAVGPARELRVAIDPKNGDIKAFAKLIATDKVISKHDQIS